MLSFLRKDLLIFWRDRKEVLIALLSPIVLIVILNFAFSGLFGEDAESLDIDVGIVLEDDESLGLEQFEETVRGMEIPDGQKERMLEQAAQLSPFGLLEEFFQNPELGGLITTEQLGEEEAKELVESGELDALVKIPEGFTREVLGEVMLGEPADQSLILQLEENSIETGTLESMLNGYIDSLNYQFALGNVTDAEASSEPVLPQGGREEIKGAETYSISQYITFSMTTLFTLFIGITVVEKTITEKRERVFERIILTNRNPLFYLMGKVISTFIFSWVQLMLVFTVSQLLLDIFPEKTPEFWFGIVLISTFFALAIAGLAAVFTTFASIMSNVDAINGVLYIVIMLMAAVGGNFTPVQGFPEWMQRIGEWTPNGLTLTTFLQWIQFGDTSDLGMPILKLSVFFAGCLVIGMFLFPKRGRA